jgi:hypothetical protein
MAMTISFTNRSFSNAISTRFFFSSLFFFFFFFFFFAELGLELWAYTLSHSTSPFLRASCQGWIQTMILQISVFSVTRITGVSHRHSTRFFFELHEPELGPRLQSVQMVVCMSEAALGLHGPH